MNKRGWAWAKLGKKIKMEAYNLDISFLLYEGKIRLISFIQWIEWNMSDTATLKSYYKATDGRKGGSLNPLPDRLPVMIANKKSIDWSFYSYWDQLQSK